MSSERTVIRETDDYVLTIVGTGEEREYGLVNKEYGVIEARGPSLPAALVSLYQIQRQFDKAASNPEAVAREAEERYEALTANPFAAFADEDDGPTFN